MIDISATPSQHGRSVDPEPQAWWRAVARRVVGEGLHREVGATDRHDLVIAVADVFTPREVMLSRLGVLDLPLSHGQDAGRQPAVCEAL